MLSGDEDEMDAFEFPLFKENKNGEPSVGIMMDVRAATAVFGGNPAVPRLSVSPRSNESNTSTKSTLKPLLFGPESPFNGAIHIIRPEDHNLQGCDDHHPGLRFHHMIPPDQFFSAPGAPPASPSPEKRTFSVPDASVLLLQRGGCTFLRKLVVAKQAGFVGAIVWNTQDEVNEVPTLGKLVNPSIDASDRAYAERKLTDVAIVVISREDGVAIDAMIQLAESKRSSGSGDVVIEVFFDAPPLMADDDIEMLETTEEGAFADEQSHVEEMIPPASEGNPASSPRILYINGLALKNTILI